MKKYPILATCVCLVAVMTAVIVGCKKEKNENADNQNERIPIAIMNNQTGEICYTIEYDEIASAINSTFAKNNRNAENYVLESYRIVDDGDIQSALEIVILDIDEEVSTTLWYLDGFLEKVIDPTQTTYYFDSNLRNGNFSYLLSDGQTYYILNIQDWQLSVEEIDDIATSNRPRPTGITCTAHNCSSSSCIAYRDANGDYGCTPCEKTKDDGYCDASIHYSIGINWDLIQTIIALLGLGCIFV